MNPPPDGSNVLPESPPVLPREAVQRWRLVLARDRVPPEAAQRESLGAWEAALAACGLPVAGLDASRPKPRFAMGAPLAASIPGEAELADLWLADRLPAWRVREVLVERLPDGWRLVDLYDVWLGEPALPGRVVASVYRAEFTPGSVDAAAVHDAAAGLLAATTLPRERRKGETTVAYDLRPFIDALDVLVGDADNAVTLRMTLRHDPEKGVGRPGELLAALGDAIGLTLEPATLVRERLVLGDPPPAPPPTPRRRVALGSRP